MFASLKTLSSLKALKAVMTLPLSDYVLLMARIFERKRSIRLANTIRASKVLKPEVKKKFLKPNASNLIKISRRKKMTNAMLTLSRMTIEDRV